MSKQKSCKIIIIIVIITTTTTTTIILQGKDNCKGTMNKKH
jgi:hypothetical protein